MKKFIMNTLYYTVIGMLVLTGMLLGATGTFAQEAETTIVKAGEQAPQLEPRFKSVSSAISFEHKDQTVVGILTEPKMEAPYPIVLMLHGFTGQKDELPIFETEETMFSRTARVLAEHGIASLRIDFRGSGDSDGEWPDTTFRGQISDALAAIDYVTSLPHVDPERIGLLGLSQGGLVASGTAAQDARIDSVVLWSPVATPYATYSTLLQQETVLSALDAADDEPISASLPWGEETQLKRQFFEELFVVDPIAEISRFSNPLLVIVGLQDTVVAPQPQMGQLYLEYHDGKELLVGLDADHIFSILAQSAEIDKAIAWSVDWFNKTL